MAAVAAASAELLIIGWYIFRVLLQVLPAEAGVHRVENRTARAGRAPPAGPQLRLQPPPLGGRVTRCSCAVPPAWEPVPRRNGASPVPSRQRSTCQGQ
ncbi:neuronatin isoform X1 [Monodon monoceros]|uniref:neuronatin isoform X1 n=1 Tax=Monodon monoceros TaxID=40151 RepID=UPI0010F4FCF5|nr:neuronatin isoform X1 [Monodon monoceros]